MAIGKGKEGAGWSKAFRERSMRLNVVRGAGGNGITGKYFIKLEMLVGWSESLLVYSSLGYPLEKRVYESRSRRIRESVAEEMGNRSGPVQPQVWGLAGQTGGL